MRYFKCETEPNNEDLKAQHGALVQKKEKINRRDAVLDKLGWVVFAVAFLGLMIGSQWPISCVTAAAWDVIGRETVILAVISTIVAVVFAVTSEIAVFFCSIALAALMASPLWGPRESGIRKKEKELRQETLERACRHLREFYGFQEPCVVTKCYDSSDKRFKDHDICLFVAERELRLTTNLLHGFLDMRRDLGCYAFRPEEIQLSDSRAGERQAVELRCGEVTFLLGQRARSFVEKNQLRFRRE